MKEKLKIALIGLIITLLVVMILGALGVLDMALSVNVLAVGIFIAILLWLLYRGQIGIVKQILLSLVIEAEKLYGAGTGPMKYNYVAGKAYALFPLIVKLFITEKTLNDLIETSVKYLKVELRE